MKPSIDCYCKNFTSRKVTKEIPIAGKKILVEDHLAKVCDDCGEIYFDGKFILDLEKQVKSREKKEWLALARKRVEIPDNWLAVDYDKDVDVLYIRLLDAPATHSDDDLDASIVFDYDKHNRLIGIEVLNLCGVYFKM